MVIAWTNSGAFVPEEDKHFVLFGPLWKSTQGLKQSAIRHSRKATSRTRRQKGHATQ
jgi:hypothetical protein